MCEFFKNLFFFVRQGVCRVCVCVKVWCGMNLMGVYVYIVRLCVVVCGVRKWNVWVYCEWLDCWRGLPCWNYYVYILYRMQIYLYYFVMIRVFFKRFVLNYFTFHSRFLIMKITIFVKRIMQWQKKSIPTYKIC